MTPSLEPTPARDASFERLYRRHRREVYGAVLRDVRDPQEAEDVTQIAFLNAFRAMRKGEEPNKPRAWLVTIARNVIKRRYRELAHRPQEVALDPEIASAVLDLDGPTAGEIAVAVRRLPPNQRAVILRREIQGRSYAEIAKELGLSLAAVETLIFRARRSLSEELELADHAPATRRARWTVFLPLPGLGKVSLDLAGRLGLAALMGTALVALPVTDGGSDPRRAPAFEPPALSVVPAAPPAASPTSSAPPVRANQDRADKPKDTKPPPAKQRKSEAPLEASGSTPGTDTPVPAPLPTVELPSTDDLPLTTVPPLPVEPPPLPVDPPPLLDLPPPPTL